MISNWTSGAEIFTGARKSSWIDVSILWYRSGKCELMAKEKGVSIFLKFAIGNSAEAKAAFKFYSLFGAVSPALAAEVDKRLSAVFDE